ncbi:MAG TPA: acetylxylan esterase, partial [Candidatus Dojkabacteria bacterium]|nr:acetylxylan esterase [Candidatus Dojkabacteria bacterium]
MVLNSYSQVNPVTKNVAGFIPQEEENLNVFEKWLKWNNSGSMLINYLTKQAENYYDIRNEEILKLKTINDWIERQKKVKKKLLELVGSFPEKTSLNPKVTGIIKKDGYKIEKIVYESMPNVYVTGCLYIPDRMDKKAPAILNVCGHNQDAFRMGLYQIINYNLVKKGIIIFAIDPPGQGEHVQYFDPKIEFSSIGYSVIEHCYFNNQLLLSGSSAARYFIWDGIRAIDYLISRKEVDPDRIGVTGWSGGGTITSYISALDERVKVSVPCSWATTNKRLLETKGIQDAEASLFRSLYNGVTFEDFLEVRAPKPTLLAFNSRDEYLTIQSAYDALSEARNSFKAFDKESNLELVEDDSRHWMTPKIREAIYSFFIKHFNLSVDSLEEEAEILSEKELQVTPTGQVSTSYGGEMIFDVSRKETEKLIKNIVKSRQNIDKHL